DALTSEAGQVTMVARMRCVLGRQPGQLRRSPGERTDPSGDDDSPGAERLAIGQDDTEGAVVTLNARHQPAVEVRCGPPLYPVAVCDETLQLHRPFEV